MRAGWLGRWYAEPLVPERTRSLFERAQCTMHCGQCSGHHCITGRLQILVARYWLDGAAQRCDYNIAVRAGFRNQRALALAELVYGQLLLSRKLTGAFDHLNAGFSLAGPMMAAEDYLNVRRCHALLRRLELVSTPVITTQPRCAACRSRGHRQAGRQIDAPVHA